MLLRRRRGSGLSRKAEALYQFDATAGLTQSGHSGSGGRFLFDQGVEKGSSQRHLLRCGFGLVYPSAEFSCIFLGRAVPAEMLTGDAHALWLTIKFMQLPQMAEQGVGDT